MIRKLVVNSAELVRRPVRVVGKRPFARRPSRALAGTAIGEHIDDGRTQALPVAGGNGSRPVRRPVGQIPNGGADDGYPARRRFESDDTRGFVTGGDDEQMSPVIEGHQLFGGQDAVKCHAGPKAQSVSERMDGAVQRIFADDVEVGVEAGVKHMAKGPEERRLILDTVQAGDLEEPPRGTFAGRGGNEHTRVHADRDDLASRAAGPREVGLVLRADGDARRQANGRRNGQAPAPVDLRPVIDVGNRRELAAVAGDDRRNAEPASGQRGDKA